MFLKRIRRDRQTPQGVLDIHQLKELVLREQERADRRGIPVSLIRMFTKSKESSSRSGAGKSSAQLFQLKGDWQTIHSEEGGQTQFDEFEPKVLTQLCNRMNERLRRTDDLGLIDQNQLLALLPDTDRDGAELVALDLIKIASEIDVCLHVELITYPEIKQDDWTSHDQADEQISDHESNGSDPTGNDSPNSSYRQTQLVAAPIPSTRTAQQERAKRAELELNQQRAERSVVSYESLWHSSLDAQQPFRIPRWKRAVDFTAAAFGLLATSPILLGCTVAVRLNSKGPAIFKQTRDGLGGKPFTIYKFRTMRTGAEAEQLALQQQNQQDGPAFKIDDDPRVTSVGKFLRRSCLDELPQLMNVLKGEMSLVGPRPLPSEESRQCQNWQAKRLTVLPGLTCFWQIHRANDIPFSDWMRMDLKYVNSMSPLTDIKLVALTFASILGFKPQYSEQKAESESSKSMGSAPVAE